MLIPESLKEYKKNAKKAAKELCYDRKYIKQIDEAKSVNEISCIMTNARKDCECDGSTTEKDL